MCVCVDELDYSRAASGTEHDIVKRRERACDPCIRHVRHPDTMPSHTFNSRVCGASLGCIVSSWCGMQSDLLTLQFQPQGGCITKVRSGMEFYKWNQKVWLLFSYPNPRGALSLYFDAPRFYYEAKFAPNSPCNAPTGGRHALVSH